MIASSFLVALLSSSSSSSTLSASSKTSPLSPPEFEVSFARSPPPPAIILTSWTFLLQEIVLVGGGILFPMSVVCGMICIRLAAVCNPIPRYIRYDVWNFIIRCIMAHFILEWLLLWLFPATATTTSTTTTTTTNFLDYFHYKTTMLEFFFSNNEQQQQQQQQQQNHEPENYIYNMVIMLLLLVIRLVWIGLGITVGEGFFPIGLTGGIACGKSTVAKLLLSSSRRSGSVYLVDTDLIAHDILLPPGDPDSSLFDPTMSVYDQVLQAFAQYDILEDAIHDDDDKDDHDHDEKNDKTKQVTQASHVNSHHRHRRHRHIDRRKLGAIVFADPIQRRLLNRLTHPRIRYIMLRQLFYGLYQSGKDFCIVDVPLLFESGGGLRWMFGLIIMVTCHNRQSQTQTQQPPIGTTTTTTTTAPEIQLQRLMRRNPDLTLEQCQQRIASQMSLERKEQMSHIVIDNSQQYDDDDETCQFYELSKTVEQVRNELVMRIHGGMQGGRGGNHIIHRRLVHNNMVLIVSLASRQRRGVGFMVVFALATVVLLFVTKSISWYYDSYNNSYNKNNNNNAKST